MMRRADSLGVLVAVSVWASALASDPRDANGERFWSDLQHECVGVTFGSPCGFIVVLVAAVQGYLAWRHSREGGFLPSKAKSRIGHEAITQLWTG